MAAALYLELIKFMAGLALKLGEASGDLPGVNLRAGIPAKFKHLLFK
jgi:hypothetical protein